MANVIFIGDEITAAGFRLAGVKVFDAPDDGLADLVAAEKGRCDMMLMTTQTAARLPRPLFDQMTQWTKPLIAFIPDLREKTAPLDLEGAVRRELGIGA